MFNGVAMGDYGKTPPFKTTTSKLGPLRYHNHYFSGEKMPKNVDIYSGCLTIVHIGWGLAGTISYLVQSISGVYN